MDIPVLIQPITGKGFLARVGSPFERTAEGATAEEAVANLRLELTRYLTNEVRATVIEVPIVASTLPSALGQRDSDTTSNINLHGLGQNHWGRLVGTLPDDEMTAMFREAVEEYRREIDADPNR